MSLRLADALEADGSCSVWEIGPGLGSMTAGILDRGAEVTAFEIDRGFCTVLREIFADNARFTLVEGDVMKTWYDCFKTRGLPRRLFGNLPYNVAAAVLAGFVSRGARFDIGVVTVQKEVAQRMTAGPGSSVYSSFSALCLWAYTVTSVADMAAGCFWPRPNVESRAVKLVRRSDWPGCSDPVFFMRMQRSLFASRRKTVKNNLSRFYGSAEKAEAVLGSAGIDPQVRAERLSVDELLALSDKGYMMEA